MSSGHWPSHRLGDVLKAEIRPIEVEATKVYREIGIRSHGKGVFHKAPLTGLELGSKRMFEVEPGDFVLNIVFAWEGAVALAAGTESGMVASHRFPTFRAIPGALEPRFLRLFFMTPPGLELLSRVSPGGAGRNRTLSREKFLCEKIPLPPLAEQLRIADGIDGLTRQLTEGQQVIRKAAAETTALRAQVRAEMFAGIREKTPGVHLGAVADCRLGKMLSQQVKTGRHSTPYLRNANIQWDRLDLRSIYEMDFDEKDKREFELKTGDILVCEGGDIGKSAIWNREIPHCCFQKALHRIRVDSRRLLPRFLLHHIFWAAEQGHFTDIKTQTTIAHLTGIKLRAYTVHIPSLAEQHRVVALLDALQAKVRAIEALRSQAAADLDALLPSVLDKAFRGEL
jgi:type I restriction enzyme S subunit